MTLIYVTQRIIKGIRALTNGKTSFILATHPAHSGPAPIITEEQ